MDMVGKTNLVYIKNFDTNKMRSIINFRNFNNLEI